MVITRWVWFYVIMIAFVLCVALLTIGKIAFQFDVGNWYWVILGGLWLLLWQNTPPYKHYKFKMKHLSPGSDPLWVVAGLGNMLELRLVGLDRTKGLHLEVYEVSGYLSDKVQSSLIKDFFLKPSAFWAILTRNSGHMQIACISRAGVKVERYLEKIPANGCGLVLHFAGQKDEGIFATVEVINKKPNFFSLFWQRRLV